MAVNYDLNVFKYNVRLTRDELDKLVYTQDRAMEYIFTNKPSNADVVARAIAGVGATAVGLIFLSQPYVAIGAGIVGLWSVFGGVMKTDIHQLSKDGKDFIQGALNTANRLKADYIVLDLAFVEIYDQATRKTIVRFVQGGQMKYFEKDGLRIQ